MRRRRITIICGACGRETARALRRCAHCGRDLHASSKICGTCPTCRLSVRETEVACANCGHVLDPAALDEVPRTGLVAALREGTLWGRFRKELLVALWPVRLLGLAVAALGATRVFENLEYFRLSDLYDQQIAVLGDAAVWFIVFAAGVGIFALSFALKPER